MSRFNTGNPLGSADPRDLDDNAKNMDQAVNAEADTFQDRLGRSRLTWAGIEKAGTGDPAIAVDAAARAEAAAYQVQQDAEQIAQDAAEQAVNNVAVAVDGAVDRAEGAADRAETAAQTAATTGRIYATAAAGQADEGLSAGDFFWVESSDSAEVLELWRKGVGAPEDTGKRTADRTLLDEIRGVVVAGEGEDAFLFTDKYGNSAALIDGDGNFRTHRLSAGGAHIESLSADEVDVTSQDGRNVLFEDKYGNAAVIFYDDGRLVFPGLHTLVGTVGAGASFQAPEIRFSGSGVSVYGRQYGVEVEVSSGGGGGAASLGKINPSYSGKKIIDAEMWGDKTLCLTAGLSSQPGMSNTESVFSPWVIRTDRVPGALAKYYMYFSTDHDLGDGGIFMAYSDSPLGPWQAYGHVYSDAVGSQTETPCVVWDRHAGEYKMYYQVKGARYGIDNTLLTKGEQTTLCATSSDGVTWTKDPFFVIDFDGLTYGNGHTGYFYVGETPTGYIAKSLYGGGLQSQSVIWHCAGALGGQLINDVICNNWYSDRQTVGRGYELTERTIYAGKRATPGVHTYTANGTLYGFGMISANRAGTVPGNANICVGALSADYKRYIETPVPIWTASEDWESADLRSGPMALIEDDYVYLYYTMAVGDTRADRIGVIRHAI